MSTYCFVNTLYSLVSVTISLTMVHVQYVSFMTYLRVCSKSNTTDATSGTGTAYPSGAPKFNLSFKWGSYSSIVSFLCSVL